VAVLVDRLHTTPHLQDVLHRKIHHAHPVEYGPSRYSSGQVDGQSRYGSRASSGSMSTEYTRLDAESARRFSSASSDGKNILVRWRYASCRVKGSATCNREEMPPAPDSPNRTIAPRITPSAASCIS